MAKKRATKKVTTFMARQGDVLIMAIEAPSKLGAEVSRENGRLVLAHGESTGHAHAIAGSCHLYMDEQRPVSTEDAATMVARLGGGLIPDRVLVCDAPVELRHEEHATVTIPAGAYKIRIQREYSPGALRNVAD